MLQAGPNIVLYHVLPAILASLIYYFVAKLFIFIFRIKRPSFRFIVYLLVLYKSLLVLITGARYSSTMVPRKPFGLGFLVYDPLDLLPFGHGAPFPDIATFSIMQSPWFYGVITFVVAIIIFLLFLRWISTALFFGKLAKDAKPLRRDVGKFVDDISAKMKLKIPDILVSDSDIGPMTIGIRKPIILLPNFIVRRCTNKEIEIIIGHEMAHVRRKDNLFQWFALIFKDLLFFSPFSHIAFRSAQLNKEQAADNLFLKVAFVEPAMLSRTIDKVANYLEAPKKSREMVMAKASFADNNIIRKRLKVLKRKNTLKAKSAVNTTLSVFGLFTFFWIRALVVIKVGQKGLTLL